MRDTERERDKRLTWALTQLGSRVAGGFLRDIPVQVRRSIAGAECLVGRTGVESNLSGVHDADNDDFPSYDEMCDRLRSTVELENLGILKEPLRRSWVAANSLSETRSS